MAALTNYFKILYKTKVLFILENSFDINYVYVSVLWRSRIFHFAISWTGLLAKRNQSHLLPLWWDGEEWGLLPLVFGAPRSTFKPL